MADWYEDEGGMVIAEIFRLMAKHSQTLKGFIVHLMAECKLKELKGFLNTIEFHDNEAVTTVHLDEDGKCDIDVNYFLDAGREPS